ncbi:hypothetical protein NP233_g11493 [Leucocoprinus birnbaumii]|uniref:Uncharacterized protein n=1 Tax=Leucocoprinus birnbaumii TaxID=56174 RepID=A0AAD5VIU2_9AGAR|nr:hypothetical protein NP233_g11493 [Leucocoprinus birnbaumii]
MILPLLFHAMSLSGNQQSPQTSPTGTDSQPEETISPPNCGTGPKINATIGNNNKAVGGSVRVIVRDESNTIYGNNGSINLYSRIRGRRRR